MFAEAGVDLNTIMKRVGHDDAKTTTKIYMHVSENEEKCYRESKKSLRKHSEFLIFARNVRFP
jgi:integrase